MAIYDRGPASPERTGWLLQMNEDTMKHIGDAAAVVVTVGTVASFLPPLAAFLTIIWTFIRILETRTVQGILRRWRD